MAADEKRPVKELRDEVDQAIRAIDAAIEALRRWLACAGAGVAHSQQAEANVAAQAAVKTFARLSR